MKIEEIPTPFYIVYEEKLRRNLELISRVKQEAGFHVRPGLFALMIKIISHEIKIPQFDHHQHPQQQERTHHQHGSQYRSRKIMFEKFDHDHSILSVYTLLPFRKQTESR